MIKGKAFSLLSGGLDSLLATRLIMAQSIEVIGLHFITPFFGYSWKGREAEYKERCRSLYGIQARVLDVSTDFFQVLKNPRYGYGKNFNPCIDCKIFLFSRAREILEQEKADFLVTGEVLGQRPMSQRRDTLRVVERDSRTDGILLRPLCAKHLPPTRPEKEGLVDREKLLDLSGRSRKPQMRMAQEMGIGEYPSPAGGCLLTDPVLAERIRKHFSESGQITVPDVQLLLLGRHFQLAPSLRLVVGRRDEENQRLLGLFQEGDILLQLKGIPGPLGLVRGPAGRGDLELASSIIARYSKVREKDAVEVQVGFGPREFSECLSVRPAREDRIAPLRF